MFADIILFYFKLIPPPISQSEAKHGLLSLIQRGLIPPSAKIAFDPEPIIAQTLNINEKDNLEAAMKKIEYPSPTLNDNIYKLDRTYELQMKLQMNKKIGKVSTDNSSAVSEIAGEKNQQLQKFLKKKMNNSLMKISGSKSNPSCKSDASLTNNQDNPLVIDINWIKRIVVLNLNFWIEFKLKPKASAGNTI